MITPRSCPFPSNATADEGIVSLEVSVDERGKLTRVVLTREPAEAAFGAAALDCVRAGRFEPALDREGKPRAVTQPLRILLERN